MAERTQKWCWRAWHARVQAARCSKRFELGRNGGECTLYSGTHTGRTAASKPAQPIMARRSSGICPPKVIGPKVRCQLDGQTGRNMKLLMQIKSNKRTTFTHTYWDQVCSRNGHSTFRDYGDEEFKEVFQRAQEALQQGIHPVLIPVGSSG